ncbi:MAG: hypothetical protein DRJ44_05235 [Thermoprotei archaeon]|nr:hypothetical protein [Thermoproteales archaeon]RLE75770.1 MAG: hypothetical protein DRJ44_05235 [Thermoprotei archaeon]
MSSLKCPWCGETIEIDEKSLSIYVDYAVKCSKCGKIFIVHQNGSVSKFSEPL